MGLFGNIKKKISTNSKLSINDLTADQCVNIEENFKRGMTPKEIAEDVGIETDLVYRYKRYRMGDDSTDHKSNSESSNTPTNSLRDQISQLRSQLNEESYLRMQYDDLKEELDHKRKIRELELANKELEFESRQLDIDERRLQLREEYGEEAEGGIFGDMTQTLVDLYQKAQKPKNPIQSPVNESQTTLQSNTTTGTGVASDPAPGTSSLRSLTDEEIRSYIEKQPKAILKVAKKMNEADLFAELQNRIPGVSAVSLRRAVEIIKAEV